MSGHLIWEVVALVAWVWALVTVLTRPKETWERGRAGQVMAVAIVVLGTLSVAGVVLPVGAVVMLVVLRRRRSRGEVGVPPAERWPGSG